MTRAEKGAHLEIVCALIAHLGFKSLTLRQISIGSCEPVLFFLYIKDIFCAIIYMHESANFNKEGAVEWSRLLYMTFGHLKMQ